MLKNFFLELFFPSFCLGCNKEGILLCSDCVATLDILQHRYCLCLREPLRLTPESTVGTCQRCRNNPLEGLYAALAYQERALTRKLLHQFKYKPYYLQALDKTLADVLLQHFSLTGALEPQVWKNAKLVPVPLYSRRHKKRGYNQSEILARQLSKAIAVPLEAENLIKIRITKPQQKLSALERQENVRDAFAIKNPAAFVGKKVFLVDDVFTTGSTMQECARALTRAGAQSVFGIVFARG